MNVFPYPTPATAAGTTKAPRRVSILGATGSIGMSTLDLIGRDPSAFDIVALTGGRNVRRLAELAVKHRARLAVIADPARYSDLADALAGTEIEVGAGADALAEAASRPADWVMGAIVGAAGLEPTLIAVRQGTCTALANKECLVAAGSLFMAEVARCNTTLLPVDSEHCAALQVMTGAPAGSIEKVCLTASGGPFRTLSRAEMETVTPERALNHPNWSMGPKITIDSATLMNKGLELIEAHHLFSLAPDQLEAVIHPQSIVHCLVFYRDGSVLAQMAPPDMRTPIAYSLAWPERMHVPIPRLDLAKLGGLSFEAPDPERFPALRVAREVLAAGGSAGTVMNAANEVAVEAFLARQIGFLAIAEIVQATLESAADLVLRAASSVEEVLAIDAQSRAKASQHVSRFA